MKKLIQILEANIQISSLSCASVKVDSDSSGDKVNENLLKDICTASKNAQVTVTITTAVSGHREMASSGNPSRHPVGNAVDISLVNNIPVKTASNRDNVDNFVNQLVILGYTKNSESGNPKSVLTFGFKDHDDHVHISNKDGSPTSTSKIEKPTSKSDEEPTLTSAEEYATDYLVKALGKVIKPMLGINESKQNRILKDIQKIRNLLK